jgi:membrane dipeptidase
VQADGGGLDPQGRDGFVDRLNSSDRRLHVRNPTTGQVTNRVIAAFSELATVIDGDVVDVQGWISPFSVQTQTIYCALTEEPSCCLGCLPADAVRRIEVFAELPLSITGRRIRLRGTLHHLQDDDAGWCFQLRGARVVEATPSEDGAFNRRQVLKAATLACLAAADLEAFATTATQVSEAEARASIENMATVDVHSHAGGIIGMRRVNEGQPFSPVADPMREGGMAVLCMATVSDSPTHHVTADRRIKPFRDPEPGELYAYGQQSFKRIHELARAQNITLVKDAAALSLARSNRPSIIVSAEGGDFLEGVTDRVDEAYDQWALRHLQLVHYRVNALGDIQTEPTVHGGLAPFGAEVVKRCNRLGIVVDVAHGTYDLVKQAASAATKPLVLSHTSLSLRPGARSRLVSPEHARMVADTGGLVGIWPPTGIFPDMSALAAGIAKMVDVIGIDHVGLGSDMRGLVGPSTFSSYRDLPLLAQALLAHGFQVQDVRKILGGNYVRVFSANV